MDNFKISKGEIEGMPVLIIEGDMTSESDSDVMKNYYELKKKYSPANLIINFEKTKYINSAGIASLINIIQDLQDINGKVIFVGLTNHFKKVMDTVGISDFVDIYNTNDEAIAKIKS
ncbi:MAG: STAS domain-containing protein [Spirochaetes bacterium]|nr:STAS domain-containing protein [Spirochaetota bacterium]